MSPKPFTKDFTRQEPICDEGIEKAVTLLKSGRLHRYNSDGDDIGEVARLEEEFAAYMGRKYCLACSSCGNAMHLALRALGVQEKEKVLCNAFTLAPVPGAIENAGAEVLLVEIKDDYTIDIDDLEKKAGTAKWLLLSHMRGHIANMERITEICRRHDIILIEDCAHTMGAGWDGRKSGSFGKIACFSTQTYKHLNSGEGGLLVTDDPDLISKAILYSGSYMLYDRHSSRPELEVFASHLGMVPGYSCRMDNLRAAILRPQLQALDSQCERWNRRYRILEKGLQEISGIHCPPRDSREEFVGSSIQFSLTNYKKEKIRAFLQGCLESGVEIKWFGNKEPVGFTSAYKNWKYLGTAPNLANTDRILSTLCDMRIPLTFTEKDCQRIALIIGEIAEKTLR